MTFANPLYSAITRQFFDLLAGTMNQSFQDRCRDLYYREGKKKTQNSRSAQKEQCVDTMIENYEEDKKASKLVDYSGNVFDPRLEKEDKVKIIRAE